MTRLRWQQAASLAMMGFVVSATTERSALADALHQPVVVELKDCEQVLAAEVRRILGVELRTTVIDAADAGNAVIRVIASCHRGEVDLSLADAATATYLERTVALAEATPTAHARLVALAVAELVAASWQEIEKASKSAKQPPPPQQQPPPARASEGASAERPQVRATAEAVGVVRAFPGSGLWLLGAGARGFYMLSRPLTLTIELTAEWGKASRTTGQVAARAIGGALGLGWGIERAWAFVMPWVGARAGVASLTGEPGPNSTTLGGTQSGACLGPEMGVSATLFPHAAVHATVALSAGAMLLGVRGMVAKDSDVNTRGPWVALVVGVGLAKP